MSFLCCIKKLQCSKVIPCLNNEGSALLRATSWRIYRFKQICYLNQNLQYNFNNVPLQFYGQLLSANIINSQHVSTSVSKILHRSFAKQRKRAKSDSDDSDNEEPDVIDKYDRSCKIINGHLPSLRLDLVLKTALGLARNKVDLAFYESRIRVNGEKVFKKSQRVNVEDEIDVVKGLSPMNPDFLIVSRIEIISAKPDEDEEEIYVKMKRFKSMQIENYKIAPYKQHVSN